LLLSFIVADRVADTFENLPGHDRHGIERRGHYFAQRRQGSIEHRAQTDENGREITFHDITDRPPLVGRFYFFSHILTGILIENRHYSAAKPQQINVSQ